MADDVLIYGDTERSATLRHEIPIAIGDPFLYVESRRPARRPDEQPRARPDRPRRAGRRARARRGARARRPRRRGHAAPRDRARALRAPVRPARTCARRPSRPSCPSCSPTACAPTASSCVPTTSSSRRAGARRTPRSSRASGARRSPPRPGMAACAAMLRAAPSRRRRAAPRRRAAARRGRARRDPRRVRRARRRRAARHHRRPQRPLPRRPRPGPRPARARRPDHGRPVAARRGVGLPRRHDAHVRRRRAERRGRAHARALDGGAAPQRRGRAPGVPGRALYDIACDVFEAAGHPTQRTKAPGEPLERGLLLQPRPRRRPRGPRGAGSRPHRRRAARRRRRLAVEPGTSRAGEAARVEDLVLVTEDGAEVLTDYPYGLAP